MTDDEASTAVRARTRESARTLSAAIREAVDAYGEAQFECGEWNRDESDEEYEAVYLRAKRAKVRLFRVLGLTPARRRTLASDLAEDR